MATTATIKKNIAKLEAALKSKATPKSLKPKLETQLVKSKAELSGMNKGTKPKTSSTKSTQTALQKLKAMVNKNKKYKTYKGAGVDLEKDADRPALRTGRRIAKESGKTYYEYRANRIDVKQPPKKYPKLEKGGYMARGGNVEGKSGSTYKIEMWKSFDDMMSKQKPFRIVYSDREDDLRELGEDNRSSKLYMKRKGKYLNITTFLEKGGYMADGGETAKFQVDDVVYHKGHNTIGIVRIGESRGEVKTDADGNVDVDELQYYNPLKHEEHKNAKIAPSTKKEIEERMLWKPFTERTSKLEKGGYMAKGGELDEKYEIELFFKGLSGDDRKIGKYVITQKTLDRLNEYLGGDWSEAISLDVIDESDKKPTSWADLKNDVYDKYAEKFHKKEKGGYMAKGGMSQDEESILVYYVNHYPEDELALEIKAKATFNGLYEVLSNKGDAYEYIGVADSIVRERVFEKLAKIKGVKYDVIYDMWMDSDYAKGGFVGKGELVWRKLTDSKKMEFLKENFTPQITPRSQEILVGKDFQFLPKDVKIKLESKYANVEEYAKGGISQKEVVESNAEMVLSQIKAVKHHAQELSNVVSKNSDIEAWVVAKIERASTDLSDITHYLEFQTKKMAMGGEIHRTQD